MRSGVRAAAGIALLFGAQFSAAAVHALRRDGDFFWQRWLGDVVLREHALPRALGAETFTAAGAPWLPQEWLFSTLLAAALHAHLFALFALAVALGAALTLLLVALRAEKMNASWPAVCVAVWFTGASMEQMFNVRAQVTVWPLFALVLLALDRNDARSLVAIPLTIVWANLHASALLSPAFALAFALGHALDSGIGAPQTRRAAIVFGGCAFAALATPFGAALPLYAFHLASSPMRAMILEWRVPMPSDPSVFLGLVPLVAVAAIAMVRGFRPARREALVFALSVALGCAAVRNVPLAAIAIAPFAARALTSMLPAAPEKPFERERALGVLVTTVVLIAAVGIGAATERTIARAAPVLPFSEIASASALPGARSLYCENFAWCSVALGHPALRTFLDGRCDPFPGAVWRAHDAIRRSERLRGELLERYGVDTVIAQTGGGLARALGAERGWRTVIASAQFTLFARRE